MAAEKVTAGQKALAFIRSLEARLPNFPDPDAVPEDPCVEIELTWKDWATIKRLSAQEDGK